MKNDVPYRSYNFHELVRKYKNTLEGNLSIYETFQWEAQQQPVIWQHRLWVEEHQLGWGDRAFHGMWFMLVNSLPDKFSFLEIGIYKGQVLSLISLISKIGGKEPKIYGISPLDAVGDKYWIAPQSDYEQDIKDLFKKFNLDYSSVNIHKGLSTDPDSFVFGLKTYPYDIVYIDGGHNYETVKSDIENYKPFVKQGGYIVMDDASCYMNIPTEINRGLQDVSDAVRDCLDNDSNFVNIFNCGHNRVFKRL